MARMELDYNMDTFETVKPAFSSSVWFFQFLMKNYNSYKKLFSIFSINGDLKRFNMLNSMLVNIMVFWYGYKTMFQGI